MMDTGKAYDLWSSQYDSNENRTRDLEGIALRECLNEIPFSDCLEIGCGTGKNTVWLAARANRIVAVDLSGEMLRKAREKIQSEKVHFIQADINQEWDLGKKSFDLVSFSLVLEHIRNLDPVFRKTADSLREGGYVYVGELHPFKQYTGTKARFDTAEGRQVLPCFNHHISDFVVAAEKSGLELKEMNEYFDEGNRAEIPRILTLLFKKPDFQNISGNRPRL